MPMGVDRELLSQRQLDDRLILSASEEREDATEDRDREESLPPTSRVRFWPSRRHEQAESRLGAALPLVDDGDHPWRKHEQNQRGRILRTHRRDPGPAGATGTHARCAQMGSRGNATPAVARCAERRPPGGRISVSRSLDHADRIDRGAGGSATSKGRAWA
jgi:hypothetical protein